MILTRADAAHFCRRVGYGGLTAEIDYFTGRRVDDVVAEVLSTPADPLPPPALLDNPDLYMKRIEAMDWWLNRMADSRWTNRNPNTPSPLREKMSFFWHGHFATSDAVVAEMRLMFEQLELFYNDGLGDFENLCQQIAVGPAMLIYLDNATNVAEAPQENFARELMELFTMGIGNYDETDVVEMARAWTGHNLVGWDQATNTTIDEYLFYPDRHDDNDKTIFGITRNWDGPETITEIVRRSKQEPTARFIARKLFSHFAHANPPEAVVNELAAVFIANNMEVGELLRAILEHPRFWDENSRNQLVKPPVDYMAELIKRTGISLNLTAVRWPLEMMGQIPFEPPNVSGWGENAYWISTATAWGRQERAATAAMLSSYDGLTLLNELADDGVTPQQAATAVFEAFGIVEQSPASRAGIEYWFNRHITESRWNLEHEGVMMGATLPEFHVA